MSDSGASPPENGKPAAESSNGSSNFRRRNNGRNNKKSNKNRQNNNTNSSFKGPLAGYESCVYDVSKNSGSDAFNTTTIRLSEYISRTVPNAGEFIKAMNPDNLGFEPIVEPADPVEGATGVPYEKWKTLHRNWDTKTQRREEAGKAAFAIIMGQCSDTLKDKMKTYDEWETIQSNLTVIELLELIRTAMYSGTATSKSTLTVIEAQLGLLNCKQTRKMTNSKYLEVFRNRVEVLVLLGGEPGTWASRVNAVLATDAADANNPQPAEVIAATAKAREEYLAVLFINNCDASKYGKRVMDLKVRYVESSVNNGGDPYPTTLAKALEMLETWDEVYRKTRHNRSTTQESGIAFATTDDDPNYDVLVR